MPGNSVIYVLLVAMVTRQVTGIQRDKRLYRYSLDQSQIPDYTANILDEYTGIGLTACGAACVSRARCLSAYYYSSGPVCKLTGGNIPNNLLSPDAKATPNQNVVYMDYTGYVPTTTTPTTTTTTPVPTTTTTGLGGLTLELGDKVIRGPDWSWGDQDGGAGSLGTVTGTTSASPGWVEITWDDNGTENEYRNGAQGKIDLAFAELID